MIIQTSKSSKETILRLSVERLKAMSESVCDIHALLERLLRDSR